MEEGHCTTIINKDASGNAVFPARASVMAEHIDDIEAPLPDFAYFISWVFSRYLDNVCELRSEITDRKKFVSYFLSIFIQVGIFYNKCLPREVDG